MKLPALLAAVTFLPLFFSEAAPPALPIDQALKLAQDYLTERGLLESHPIESLTLEKSSVFAGQTYWLARWDPPIRIEDKTDSALQINLDGSLILFTSGGPSHSGAPTAAGQRPNKHRFSR